jgi:hypothetical protein
MAKACTILVGKYEEKRPYERCPSRWKDNNINRP